MCNRKTSWRCASGRERQGKNTVQASSAVHGKSQSACGSLCFDPSAGLEGQRLLLGDLDMMEFDGMQVGDGRSKVGAF